MCLVPSLIDSLFVFLLDAREEVLRHREGDGNEERDG
jgi:hypothetical protein